jgi:hypothetical protein
LASAALDLDQCRAGVDIAACARSTAVLAVKETIEVKQAA